MQSIHCNMAADASLTLAIEDPLLDGVPRNIDIRTTPESNHVSVSFGEGYPLHRDLTTASTFAAMMCTYSGYYVRPASALRLNGLEVHMQIGEE